MLSPMSPTLEDIDAKAGCVCWDVLKTLLEADSSPINVKGHETVAPEAGGPCDLFIGSCLSTGWCGTLHTLVLLSGLMPLSC